VAGLRDDERTAIASVDLGQKVPERDPARVARGVLPPEPDVRMLPLVGVVVVDADDVEIARVSAEVGIEQAGEHGPGVELALPLVGGRGSEVGPAAGGTTWISGSIWIIRAPGSTAQIASMPAMAARTS
jgi:hypothetical protein